MKNIYIILLSLILLTGCSIKDTKEENVDSSKHIEEEVIENIKTYTDNNNTPISIFDSTLQYLNKVSNFNTTLNPLEDINIFQIFPSNDQKIVLNEKFGQVFYNEWLKYNKDNILKIGFNFKFTNTDGRKISFNILDPSMTNNIYDEYLLIYLYDDYKNINSNFYSHLEQEDYNDDTLFTSIKIQAGGHSFKINSKIELTVFTYDGLDDFDENDEYRGNSSYKINICIEGLEC